MKHPSFIMLDKYISIVRLIFSTIYVQLKEKSSHLQWTFTNAPRLLVVLLGHLC